MEEAHAEAMLSAFGISNECALGSDVVPMVFGFFRYPRSGSHLALASNCFTYNTESRNDTQCPSHKTSFDDALAFAFSLLVFEKPREF